jgi:capsular polysaccharide export protein
LTALLARGEFGGAAPLDNKLINAFDTFNAAYFGKTAGLLTSYFDAMKNICQYQFDQNTDNVPLTLWTEYFIAESERYARTDPETTNLIRKLLLANLAAYRPASAGRLLCGYIGAFTDPPRRAELFYQITTAPCGQLPVEYIEDMAAGFADQMQRFAEPGPDNTLSADWQRKTYMRCMLRLAAGCRLHLPDAERYVEREIESGDDSFVIFRRDKPETNDQRTPARKEPPADNENAFFLDALKDPRRSRKEVCGLAERNIEKFRRRATENGDLTDTFSAIAKLYYFKYEYDQAAYWAHFERTLNRLPHASRGDTVYFLVNEFSLVGGSNALPLLLEAGRRGYAVVPTSPLNFRFEQTEDEWLNDIAGAFLYGNDRRKEFREFRIPGEVTVDIPNKRIMINGMNVYQPIYEFVSRYQFSYFFRSDTDAWVRMKTARLTKLMAESFTYCEEIERWAVSRGVRVRFIGAAPHLHPAAPFRIYCEERGYKNGLEFIVVNSGYDNYFKNVGDALTDTVSALNLTKNLNARNSFLGTEQGFAEFCAKNKPRYHDFERKIATWLSWQRSKNPANLTAEKNVIIERIKAHKAAGKRVILLNGKVIFDLCVKSTRGVVHTDMSHWITHTVEIANANPDILLLIKPHPHERLKDLTLTHEKTDTLRNIIMTEMNDNVIYVDSDAFRIAELIDYADLGLLWNGTSSLEFAAQGLETLLGDYWAYCDYPIGFTRVNSLEEYERALVAPPPHMFENKEGIQEKAIMFLAYMESEDVRVPNRYSRTSSLNFHQFESEIYDDKIGDFLRDGDPALERYFDALD